MSPFPVYRGGAEKGKPPARISVREKDKGYRGWSGCRKAPGSAWTKQAASVFLCTSMTATMSTYLPLQRRFVFESRVAPVCSRFPRRQSSVGDDEPAPLNFGFRTALNVATLICSRRPVNRGGQFTPPLRRFHSLLWSMDHAEIFALTNREAKLETRRRFLYGHWSQFSA
jgi:hypothetical protein